MRGCCGAAVGAAFCFALAMAPAAAGQGLFVVSQNDQRVLEYDPGDGGFLRVFVEPITEGFQTPGGIALHPTTGDLYVSSTATGAIWVYDTPSGDALPPPAASGPGLIQPAACVFDASGDTLFFLGQASDLSVSTDALNQMVVASGAVSTLATDASAGFSGIARDGSTLYVTDSINGTVKSYPTSGGSGSLEVSGLSGPRGILMRSPTQMLVAETGLDRVVEYTFGGAAWVFDREVLPASANVDGPVGLALDPGGRLTVSGTFSDDVVLVDLDTLAVTPLVSPGAGGLSIAGQLAWSGSTLLVASQGTNDVVYYDAAGAPTGVAAKGISTPTDTGLAIVPGGNVLVGSSVDNDIVEYDGVNGALVRKLFTACPLSFTSPFDVAVGPGGSVYVSCPPTGGIFRFNSSGNAQPFVIDGSGGLTSPRSIAFGPSGNLFVANTGFFVRNVLEFDGGTGAFVRVLVDDTGNGGGAVDPYGLAFHAGGLFVTSFAFDNVMQFDATTGAFVRTLVSPGSGGLSGPRGLAFGPGGDLFVASSGDHSVKRYDGSTGSFLGSFVPSGSGGLDGPADLGFGWLEPIPVPAPGPVARAVLCGALAALGWRLLTRSPAVRRPEAER